MIQLLDTLKETTHLKPDEFLYILDHITQVEKEYLFSLAKATKNTYYQNRVYLRALIEISNYCKQGCKYCGINHTIETVERYRLSKTDILKTCETAYLLGYRTFVIQGGEDAYYTDELLVDLIHIIKHIYPDTRITLSLGERPKASLQKLFDAGVDRYLLRHETASKRLYEHIHPAFMSFEHRRQVLTNLKEIGYQVGAGFMVGLPTQTNKDLVKDLDYLKDLSPHMIGIGPYLCHSQTELAGNQSGSLDETLVMVALTRLILPKALLPATTALGTLHNTGREQALNAGANVMMPNVSPTENRKQYEIYQNKICTGDTSLECRGCIETRIKAFDHEIDLGVGDFYDLERTKNDR
ncbi:MAG: [FeFe] hydrogenase H-cluster radical SAM maturase HydE [Candidatus Izimaplasma sp.]|nr:[FeFe] hydrogenase H-cluster radical SAM maturase HydE [Candidatus Izimaplasma bacterium]